MPTIDTATGMEAPAELSTERVLSIFTGIASKYEKFNHYASFGQDRVWLHKLVESLPITSTSRVLDVAGGTGEVTFEICKRHHPAHIVLSDYTPAMINVAQSRIERGDNRTVNVDVQLADAQNMPFDDASFDIAVMAYGIRNMPDRPRALKEINRVLAPGGTVSILEFSTPPLAPARAFYKAYLKWGIPAWGHYFTGKRDDFVYLANSIQAFPNQKSFVNMLKAAGFQDVKFTNLAFGAACIYTARTGQ